LIDAVEPIDAKAKLALSRAELIAAMGYEEIRSETDGAMRVLELRRPAPASRTSAIGAALSRSTLGRWWHRNPLSGVVELGRPVLEHYAQRHPGKLVAYGAATGALLWVIKPWKLLSAATVVTLIFRSTDIAGMISDVVAKATGAAEDNVRALPRPRPPRPPGSPS